MKSLKLAASAVVLASSALFSLSALAQDAQTMTSDTNGKVQCQMEDKSIAPMEMASEKDCTDKGGRVVPSTIDSSAGSSDQSSTGTGSSTPSSN